MFPPKPFPALAAALLALGATGRAQEPPAQLERLARWFSPRFEKLKRTEARLRERLDALPPAPQGVPPARLGALTQPSPTPDAVEWMQVELGGTETIDAVVLVGACPSGAEAGERAYGFPVRFRVEVARGAEFSEPVTIADFSAEDFPNPGRLPVWIAAPGVVARTVRVTATRLSREGRDHCLALGELMVLRGERNLAADRPRKRTTISHERNIAPVWHRYGLTDGLSVLGPPLDRSAGGTLRFQSVGQESATEPVWVQVDLGARMPIEEVLLFPASPKEVPAGTSLGFPRAWRLSISDDASFAHESMLGSVRTNSFLDPGACAVVVNRKAQPRRYVRFTATELAQPAFAPFLALAELQVWSGQRNAALGRPVTTSSNAKALNRGRAALVDGFTDQGRIVERAAWLRGLSERRETLQRLAQNLASQQQDWRTFYRAALGWSVAALALLALGVVVLIHRARRARLAGLLELRQRLAQDLHDEIGSSLGGMALLCQLAAGREEASAPARAEFLRLHHVAHETATSARELVAVLREPENLARNLGPYFHSLAGTLLPGIRWEFEVQRPDAERALPMRVLRQVRLVFKEALHNAARHGRATFVRIRLCLADERLALEVCDDGCGFDPDAATAGSGLRGLRERAHALGGSLAIETAPGAGTTLRLEVPLSR